MSLFSILGENQWLLQVSILIPRKITAVYLNKTRPYIFFYETFTPDFCNSLYSCVLLLKHHQRTFKIQRISC